MTVINTNVTVLPHIDDGDAKIVLPALHVTGTFDRSKGGELCVPALNTRYFMHDHALLFMRASELTHYVRPVVGEGQRTLMLHTTSKDMLYFVAVDLPPTPAERRAHLEAARDPNEVTICPFYDKVCRSFSGVKIHVQAAIRKLDEDHEKDEATQWLERMKLQTATAGLKRRGGVRKARKAEKKRKVGKMEEMDSNDGDTDQANAEESDDER